MKYERARNSFCFCGAKKCSPWKGLLPCSHQLKRRFAALEQQRHYGAGESGVFRPSSHTTCRKHSASVPCQVHPSRAPVVAIGPHLEADGLRGAHELLADALQRTPLQVRVRLLDLTQQHHARFSAAVRRSASSRIKGLTTPLFRPGCGASGCGGGGGDWMWGGPRRCGRSA